MIPLPNQVPVHQGHDHRLFLPAELAPGNPKSYLPRLWSLPPGKTAPPLFLASRIGGGQRSGPSRRSKGKVQTFLHLTPACPNPNPSGPGDPTSYQRTSDSCRSTHVASWAGTQLSTKPQGQDQSPRPPFPGSPQTWGFSILLVVFKVHLLFPTSDEVHLPSCRAATGPAPLHLPVGQGWDWPTPVRTSWGKAVSGSCILPTSMDSAWPETTISAERLPPAGYYGHCHQGLMGRVWHGAGNRASGRLDIWTFPCPAVSAPAQVIPQEGRLQAPPSDTCLAGGMLLWEPDGASKDWMVRAMVSSSVWRQRPVPLLSARLVPKPEPTNVLCGLLGPSHWASGL